LTYYQQGKRVILHKNVQCESCHGSARNHIVDTEVEMKVGNWYLCLKCHETNDELKEEYYDVMEGNY
ncbi:cytochrome c3 family protein, partial [bacterium]|nr:cytochrome c3 family protein [bacterium]